MNRRGHGEGTIYQRKDGRYEASLRLGEGKRRSFYGKTRKEVRDKLNEALRAHESGRLSAGSRLTVSAYLDQWLEDRVKPTVRATTYASYARNVRLIASYVGSLRLVTLCGIPTYSTRTSNWGRRSYPATPSTKRIAYCVPRSDRL
jgi:hypothetical protein